jgi:hypothetical protein
MTTSPEGPDFGGNACALLSYEDAAKLWQAACILVDERGLLVRITSFVGQWIGQAGHKGLEACARVFGPDWRKKVDEYAEEALWRAQDIATLGMDRTCARKSRPRLYKAAVSATGAAGGWFGLPGLAAEIPASTLLIMRSIAEIGREHGEDLTSVAGRLACLEVIALGGPGTEDDDMEAAYWSTRAMFMHATLEVAIRQAATKFGTALSEKAVARAVPVLGAVAGCGLNFLFLNFYQQMARAHFTIRAVERASGSDDSIRACFEQLVRQARERRRLRKPGHDPRPATVQEAH